MPDIHKMAMVMSLLRRNVPKEVAGLVADAVHPFAELGNWPPSRKAKKEAKSVSVRIAGAIGRYPGAVPVEELKGWTRWAFTEYARIAGPGSPVGKMFAEAAARTELVSATRQREHERIARQDEIQQALDARERAQQAWDEQTRTAIIAGTYGKAPLFQDRLLDITSSETPPQLLEFEQSIMDGAVASGVEGVRVSGVVVGDIEDVFEALREQLRSVKVKARGSNEEGMFYTTFAIDSDLPAARGIRNSIRIHGAADVKGLEEGAEFIVYVTNGYLDTLQRFSRKGPWPEQIEVRFAVRWGCYF